MFALGIDFGTSGVRGVVIEGNIEDTQVVAAKVVAQSSYRFKNASEASSPHAWFNALMVVIGKLPQSVQARIERILVNGTSATMLLCDNDHQPIINEALMYDNPVARLMIPEIRKVSPENSPTLSATSTLAKAMWWYENGYPSNRGADYSGVLIAHQADWLACVLSGEYLVSDYHNALKLGYDVNTMSYPDWLLNLPIADWLPHVVAPGTVMGSISPSVLKHTSLSASCVICAGTTDSIAAFLASGASQPGDAVTSLGSTLVLKLLSERQINDQAAGIYSHRLGDLWLTGGASNTGGAVLKTYFSSAEIAELSARIDISDACPFDYYPLNSPGERFPINDPDYPPRLSPRPVDEAAFLYGLLDAIARIESEGYQKLTALGAPPLNRVYTAGGGAQNITWQTIRQRRLTVPVSAAEQTEAAYGSALLALNGLAAYESN